MRRLLLVSVLGVLSAGPLLAQGSAPYRYLSPLPGSKFVALGSGLIIRPGADIDPASLAKTRISVTGEKSGSHSVRLLLSDDRKTVVGNIAPALAPAERVEVSVGRGMMTVSGQAVPDYSFSFTTTARSQTPPPVSVAEESDLYAPHPPAAMARRSAGSTADTLPPDFPQITVNTSTTPAPGYFFLTVSQDVPGVGYYAMMIDNAGKVVKYKRAGNHYVYDFKIQPNGLLSYGQLHEAYWFAGGGYTTHMIFDTTLALIDSFQCGNGYTADGHDFLMLPNGHALLIAYDVQPVDMSEIVAGGNASAWVSGSIIQELDLQRNVVFQWRSWDHVPITDSYQNLKLAAFDYIHVNSLDVDQDGNIIAGARLTCAVYKLDRQSGNVTWTLGGKKNQFTFVNEHAANAPTYFYFQHDAHLLENGNMLMYDNGNGHVPANSRAVEYALDQATMTATLVWEFRHTPDIASPTQGSARRLPNGNTVVGWGSASLTGSPSVTEVRPSGEVVFELTMGPGLSSYRAYKFSMDLFAPAAQITQTELAVGNTYAFNQGDTIATGVSMTLEQGTGGYNSATVKRYELGAALPVFADAQAPSVPPRRYVMSQSGFGLFRVQVEFDSLQLAAFKPAAQATIYQRPSEGSGTFSPLTTEYDPVAHVVRATTNQLGEFVIGLPSPSSRPGVPTLVTPEDSERVNQTLPVRFRWSTYGLSPRYHLQVSEDAGFATTLIDDTTLTDSYHPWPTAMTGSLLWWRVRAQSDTGWTGWSVKRQFSLSPPFLAYQSPAGGTHIVKGTKAYVRWLDNLDEPVRIRLMKSGVRLQTINDSTASSGVYQWSVPQGLAPDTGYAIVILSRTDSTLLSAGPSFTVEDAVAGVRETSVPPAFALMQNYPNPFNPSTNLGFRIARAGPVKLTVFDILGREVARLIDEVKPAGDYEVTFDASGLATGLYLAKLQSGSNVAIRKMLLIR